MSVLEGSLSGLHEQLGHEGKERVLQLMQNELQNFESSFLFLVLVQLFLKEILRDDELHA